MKVGFTGTRNGCTLKQKAALRTLLESLHIAEFHHGDCIGADAQAHHCLPAHTPVHIHPADTVERNRAFCKTGNIVAIYAKLPPLDRNKVIVDSTDMLVACPATMDEMLNGGTWSTVRYARRTGKPITFVLPDGTTSREGPR